MPADSKKAAAPFTRVPDRSPGVPLGTEADALARVLLSYLGGGGLPVVPAMNGPGWSEWLRGGERKRPVPTYLVEWAVALLAGIPERKPKRKAAGRPSSRAVEQVKLFVEGGIQTAEAARLVAQTITPGLQDRIVVEPDDQGDLQVWIVPPGQEALEARKLEIESLGEKLSRAVYRSNERPSRPKPKRKRAKQLKPNVRNPK
jgi:hypothetical protein